MRRGSPAAAVHCCTWTLTEPTRRRAQADFTDAANADARFFCATGWNDSVARPPLQLHCNDSDAAGSEGSGVAAPSPAAEPASGALEVQSTCPHPIRLRVAYGAGTRPADCATAGHEALQAPGITSCSAPDPRPGCACLTPWLDLEPGGSLQLGASAGAINFTAHIERPGGGVYTVSGRGGVEAWPTASGVPPVGQHPSNTRTAVQWWARVSRERVMRVHVELPGPAGAGACLLLCAPPASLADPAPPSTPPLPVACCRPPQFDPATCFRAQTGGEPASRRLLVLGCGGYNASAPAQPEPSWWAFDSALQLPDGQQPFPVVVRNACSRPVKLQLMFFEGTASSPYADDTIVYGVGEMGEEALTTPWLVAAPGEMLHVGDASVLPWYYAAYVNASSTGNSTASGARGTQAAVTWLSVPRPPYATSRAEWGGFAGVGSDFDPWYSCDRASPPDCAWRSMVSRQRVVGWLARALWCTAEPRPGLRLGSTHGGLPCPAAEHTLTATAARLDAGGLVSLLRAAGAELRGAGRQAGRRRRQRRRGPGARPGSVTKCRVARSLWLVPL